MNIDRNARLTPLGRAELARRVVECGQSIAEVAAAILKAVIASWPNSTFDPSLAPDFGRCERWAPNFG
jgi:hypothetical protein